MCAKLILPFYRVVLYSLNLKDRIKDRIKTFPHFVIEYLCLKHQKVTCLKS